MLALVMLGTLPLRAQVTLDLRNADLKSFVQIVAESTGRNFILDPLVQGSVTVVAPKDVSAEALFEIFLNVLELNRLTIVKGVDADRIVPISNARELAPGIAGSLAGGGFETRVIRVQNVPLGEITEVIRPLLPSEAVLSTVPAAGLIILSDRRENHRRIARLIEQLDQSRTQPIELVRLLNSDATEILQILQSLEITPDGAKLTVDRRLNALVVAGNEKFRARIRILVGELDARQSNMESEVVELRYADATAMADVVLRSFAALEGKINIVAEPRSNTLLVTAPPENILAIVASIKNLDRRPKQVLIEAVIFEMSVEGFSDLTAQFGTIINGALAGGVQFALEGRPTLASLVSTVVAGGTFDAGNGGTIGGVSGNTDTGFAGLLSAIARTTSTRLLSTPSILTLNNQEAEIVVAQNVPFVTGSFATVGDTALPETPFQTIERQDIGLTLQVTPQITADNTVRLAIRQEVSNLTKSVARAGGEITSKRTISTNVLVQNANVIMLGGLLEDGSGAVGQKVPGLGDLPVFGGLFRGRNASETQRVLIMLLRPRIVNSNADARRLTLEVARHAKRASVAIEAIPDGQYPAVPRGNFPFDGADLNQPFDAGFVDGMARSRNYPPLPSRLRFKTP